MFSLLSECRPETHVLLNVLQPRVEAVISLSFLRLEDCWDNVGIILIHLLSGVCLWVSVGGLFPGGYWIIFSVCVHM